MNEDEVWACSMATVRVLAEMIVAGDSGISVEERSAFSIAAKTVVQTINDNLDDAEDIRSEADELEALGRIISVDFLSETGSLLERASDLDERKEPFSASAPEVRKFKNGSDDDDFDIDSLFKGLTER